MRLNLSKARKELGRLRKERGKLENEIASYLSRRKLIAGSPVVKYKACNKGNCKCTRGELHGPAYYISRKEDRKTKMIYVRQKMWPKVEEKIRRYQRWRSIRAQVVRLNSQILLLIDRMEKAVTEKPPGGRRK